MYSACYFCQILSKPGFSPKDFNIPPPNIKFHKNQFSKSQVAPCKRTDGWADIMKLIAAFMSFADAPKSTLIVHATHSTVSKASLHQQKSSMMDNRFESRPEGGTVQAPRISPHGTGSTDITTHPTRLLKLRVRHNFLHLSFWSNIH
jgi:hypothetical protein